MLSVGYGQGHHSAAAALAEQYRDYGWDASVADVCQLAQPRLFRYTQNFYGFCVRRAPWLWGITYALTDTADWATMVRRPAWQSLSRCMQKLLCDYRPDLIICTYPLFAYILDMLKERGEVVPPYAVVVTDALEISRPWMKSRAELVLVPDEQSQFLVEERYALPARRVVASGFPVRRAFVPMPGRSKPGEAGLRVLYGAYRQTGGVVNDIAALMGAFPQIHLTVIAGRRAEMLRRKFAPNGADGSIEIVESTDFMSELLAESHFYIGKAGAATVFECYASNVPVLINFTLPGQEQGNLELLLHDGAGCHVESTAHLVATMQKMLANDASGWCAMCKAMREAKRTGAAQRIAMEITKRFGV